MLNKEKYKDELEKVLTDVIAVLDSLNYCALDREIENVDRGLKEDCDDRNCNACKKQLREWLLAEAEILDDAEKRYLRGVIRPFRDKVRCITKHSDGREWIVIEIINDVKINFPYFEEGSMYRGMELYKNYTIEELGL